VDVQRTQKGKPGKGGCDAGRAEKIWSSAEKE